VLLSELFDVIVVRSGQFILPNDDIELNQTRFLRLVRVALGKYSNHCPVDLTFPLQLNATRNFTFNSTFIPKGESFEWGIPEFISSVTPTALAGSPAYSLSFNDLYGSQFAHGRDMFNQGNMAPDPNFHIPGQKQVSSEQLEKLSFPWVYRKPKLYIPVSSDVEVVAVYRHPIVEVDPTDADSGNFDLPTISYSDEEFIDLLQGMFLRGLGQSRRAFTMDDLPITSDASEIASEGQALEEAAMERIENVKAKFYLAYGD